MAAEQSGQSWHCLAMKFSRTEARPARSLPGTQRQRPASGSRARGRLSGHSQRGRGAPGAWAALAFKNPGFLS